MILSAKNPHYQRQGSIAPDRAFAKKIMTCFAFLPGCTTYSRYESNETDQAATTTVRAVIQDGQGRADFDQLRRSHSRTSAEWSLEGKSSGSALLHAFLIGTSAFSRAGDKFYFFI